MANYNLTQTGDEVQAYIDSIPVIDVTGTLSGSNIVFATNPYTQIAANYAADCGSYVRLTVGTDIYLIPVLNYDGTTFTGSVIKDSKLISMAVSSSEAAGKVGSVGSGGGGGRFYGFYTASTSLPTTERTAGYAYVGSASPFEIWNYNGTSWSDSGAEYIEEGGNIEDVEVSVSDTSGTPSGQASLDGTTLALSFSGLKGSPGAAGEQGPAGPQGPQGPQGNSGYSGAAGELEVVNNYTEGGATAALSAEAGKQMYIDLGAEVSENYTRYEYPSIFGNYYFNASSLASNAGFWCTEPIIVHDGETITSPVTSNTALATVAADQLPLTSSSVITRIGQNAAATYTNNTGADVYVIIACERNHSYGIPITGNTKKTLKLSGLDNDIFQTQNVVSLPKRENISVGKFAAAGLAANSTGGYWYQYGNAALLLTTPIELKSGDILHVTTTLGTYLAFARVPQGETQSSTTHYIGMWSRLSTDQKKNASIKVDEDMDIVFYCNANELKEVWVEHAATEMMTSEMVYPVIANESLVQCQDSDVCLIMGSSLTHNDYSPKSMSWIERVNDLVDIGIVNGGHSGANLSGNITDMTTGTINLLGVSLSSLKPRYIVSNNDANSTPTGSSLDEQLKQFGQIAKGVGATWLVCGEEPTLINAGKYDRQAAMTMQGVNYFPSALLWYNLNRTQSYAGWLDSSRVHSNMKNGSSHVAMVEMLEKLYIHKSVKFYKIRENYKNGSPTTSDLVYSSRIERAKKWRATCPAIGNGTSPWANDNIDGTGYISGETAGVDLMTDTTITSEVATAKGGGNITFYKHALCEIIVPRIQVTQATITMNCSVTPTGVGYIANGAYVSVTPTYADGVLTITLSAANIQNYDKICLVISDTTDATFTLGGVKCVIADGQPKTSYEIKYKGRKSGTELMTKTSVESGWTFSGNGSVKQLPSAVRNYTALNNVANHIQLDDDSATASYTQSIGRQVHKVAVRIAATIWPLIQTVRTSNDYTTTTQNLFRGMYYGGDLLLTINDAYIPLHIESGWMEVYAEAVIDSDSLSIKLGRFTNFDASYNIGGYPVMIHNVSVQEISV